MSIGFILLQCELSEKRTLSTQVLFFQKKENLSERFSLSYNKRLKKKDCMYSVLFFCSFVLYIFHNYPAQIYLNNFLFYTNTHTHGGFPIQFSAQSKDSKPCLLG